MNIHFPVICCTGNICYSNVCCLQTASVVSAELEETDSNASALTIGDSEPPRKQFCFKNATYEVIVMHCHGIVNCTNFLHTSTDYDS